jgi:hypothetical protein
MWRTEMEERERERKPEKEETGAGHVIREV